MEDNKQREKMNCGQVLGCHECVDGIRDDFKPDEKGIVRRCRFWVAVSGKLPQSEQVVYHFDCAFAWMVTTHIEMSQTNRFVAASSDKLSNEVNHVVGVYKTFGNALKNVADQFQELNDTIKKLPRPNTQEIENINHKGE